MSILACLVGTIVVIICILSIIQALQMGGRPRAEVEMAQKFVDAMEEIERLKEELKKADETLSRDERDQNLMKELDERVIKLRMQFDSTKSGAEVNRELQKELEQAVLQLTEMAKEKPPVLQEIEALKKELIAKKKSPEDLLAKIVVQPGGSGLAAGGGNLFFVEATGGALTLYKSKTEKTRVTTGSIGTDKEYDAFLEKIKKTPNATVIFLIRDDGWWSYVRGAGWAEATFQLKTGKLPIPTKGAIDLAQFERFMAP